MLQNGCSRQSWGAFSTHMFSGKSTTALSLVKYNKSTRHTWESQFKSLWGDCTRVNSWCSWIFHLLFLIWPIQALSFQTCKIHVWKVNSRRMELTPLKPKTNMRPWKSTNFETETYGNSSWKTSMLGQKMRKRRKTCLQKLPFVNFIRRRMAKDWYLGVCPMRVRRDSPIDTRQISLKPGSDGKNTREVWHYQS